MTSFFITLVVSVVVMVLITVPVLLAARLFGEAPTIRRFLTAAGIVGSLVAVARLGTSRLEQQCLEAGNPNCYDSGSVGFQAVLVLGLVFAVVLRSAQLFKDRPVG